MYQTTLDQLVKMCNGETIRYASNEVSAIVALSKFEPLKTLFTGKEVTENDINGQTLSESTVTAEHIKDAYTAAKAANAAEAVDKLIRNDIAFNVVDQHCKENGIDFTYDLERDLVSRMEKYLPNDFDP